MFFDYFNEFYLKQGFGATYIITELCWCFAIAIMFNFQSGAKKVIIATFLDAAIVWIAQILLNCSITYFCSLAGNTSINPYLKFIVWLVIPLLHTFYPTDIKKYALRLTYGLAVCVFILFGACISGSVGSAITNAFHVPTNVWSDWTMYIVICLVITTIVILKKFPVSKYKYIRNIPTFAIDGILFLSYSIYFFYFVYSFGKDSSHFDFILPIILYLTCILAYVSYYFNIKDYNNIIDNQAKEMNAESAKKQLQIFTYKYDELHMIRHDIANQFGTFEELLKEKKYDELEQYCQSFSQKVNIALDFIDCGNDALSAILNMELAKAEQQKIGIRYKVSVPPVLKIEESDLVSLFSNLIDNAIEAEIRYNKNDKQIEVEIRLEGNYLIADVKNAINSEVDKKELLKLHSNKPERMYHGYGTKIIQSVVQKYHGYINYDTNGEVFETQAMLALNEAR